MEMSQKWIARFDPDKQQSKKKITSNNKIKKMIYCVIVFTQKQIIKIF